MQGALKFHLWLMEILESAIKNSSRRSTWIEKLAWDVDAAVSRRRTVAFESVKYLPNLTFHRTYSYTPGPFRYDQTEIVSTTLSSILRLWLQFPSDELSLLQLSLINIVVSKAPYSVFFLDKIWEMYATPFSTVCSSKANIDKSLAELQLKFDSHSFATAGSKEHVKLEHLSKLITEWMEINGLDSGMAMVRRHSECSWLLKNL